MIPRLFTPAPDSVLEFRFVRFIKSGKYCNFLQECVPDCVCDDASNNTFACVRRQIFTENLNLTNDLVYCEFQDQENFVEIYDLLQDPAQLKNLRASMDPSKLQDLNLQVADFNKSILKRF